MNAALNGDTVLVHPGAYVENINFNGKNIVVGSLFIITGDTAYIAQTIIDGNQAGSVVTFENGEDTTAVLSGFTITNGMATDGGGIYCWFSSPKLENNIIVNNTVIDYVLNHGGGGIRFIGGAPILRSSVISNNTVLGGNFSHGGGIYCEISNAVMQDLVVSNNTANAHGGGINIESSSPLLENIVITRDSAAIAGGIGIVWSNVILKNVEIYENSAHSKGGGISVGGSTLILKNVVIKDNYTWFEGGGMSIGSDTDMRNCSNVIVTNNRSDLWGGGIAMDAHSDSAVYLANVVVANNSAGNGGGGIYFGNQRPVLNNVTIINNHCPNRGGGIFGRNGPGFSLRPILINCIVWNNDSTQIEIQNGDITISNSDIQGGINGIILDNSTLNWLDGNIDADPLFVDTTNGDYTLTQNSPCIDAGTAFLEWDGQVWLNLPDTTYYGAAPDMGAFEFDPNVFIDIPQHISTRFQLFQNYPNPFNLSTTIEYSIAIPGVVSLAIYDLLGKKIRTLINDRQAAGHYTVRWNGVNESGNPVSSGVYLYKLKMNNTQVLSKRMLLIK